MFNMTKARLSKVLFITKWQPLSPEYFKSWRLFKFQSWNTMANLWVAPYYNSHAKSNGTLRYRSKLAFATASITFSAFWWETVFTKMESIFANHWAIEKVPNKELPEQGMPAAAACKSLAHPDQFIKDELQLDGTPVLNLGTLNCQQRQHLLWQLGWNQKLKNWSLKTLQKTSLIPKFIQFQPRFKIGVLIWSATCSMFR